MAHPAMEHLAEVSAPAKMDTGIVDDSMMGHDMSDPAMAQAMEADMRNRFFVSLLLTIPVILYSSAGREVFSSCTCPLPLASTQTGSYSCLPRRLCGGAAGSFTLVRGVPYVIAHSI